MGPKRKGPGTPTQKKAKTILKKYGRRMTPDKRQRLRKALFSCYANDGPSTDRPTSSRCDQSPVGKMPSNPTKILLKNCVIKGYHVFQIRPPKTNPPTQLTIDREYTNTHDANACLVWLPPLETFPEHIHDQFTDEKRQLILSDVARSPIGHVPKCLSEVFCDVMDNGGKIFAEVTGDPVPSFPPWPSKDQEGGGIVLPCQYSFFDIDIDVCFNKLKKCLDNVTEGKIMELLKEL
ncbi:uncharacterized protein LOC132723619 [Ruditapes philippinarum]|uniref:uncharacterized protein LOC132723619 n=1 Tax=Ruditapes philippinarum TaxID=129788 RepID=UPI00295C34A6|nr:uncharacterized protein LOC132723619 [Ruditapes philippinarum]